MYFIIDSRYDGKIQFNRAQTAIYNYIFKDEQELGQATGNK